MPTYHYRCPSCAEFGRTLPMSGATAAPARCPACDTPSPRVFHAPAIATISRPLAAARGREEASRDSPAVVRKAPQGPPPAAAVRARPDRPPLPRP